MSDRFKFRAWDRIHKKYWEDFQGGEMSARIFSSSRFEFIIEQSTGLQDRNGNLIMEGDIITGYGQTDVTTVSWDDAGHWSTYLPAAEEVSLFDCVIIGNIHENPELLSAGVQESKSEKVQTQEGKGQ